MQPEPQAPVNVVLRVINRRSSDVAFGFEPWGDQFPLPTGATYEVAAEGPPGDGFEVVLGDDYVEVWPWWGSVARVTSNGVEIARSAFRVPPQPGPRLMGTESTSIVIEGPNTAAELLARAHRRPNGERAWRPADAVAATEALAAAGYAVLGGEWWIVQPDGAIRAAVPATASGPAGVYGWSVRPGWEPATESWQAFCERAAAYTVAVLRGEEPGSASLPAIEVEVRRDWPDLWPRVWYNLTFAGRDWRDASMFR